MARVPHSLTAKRREPADNLHREFRLQIVEAPTTTANRSCIVLVVDDNQDAADALAMALRLSGHRVDVAYNGLCALARFRSTQPDVVLCDLGLPELSGYDFAKAVRREQARPIRLVAISGYAQADDIKRSREAGFDAHLAKPAQPSEIQSLFA